MTEEKQALITKLKLRIAYFEELQISGPESFSNHQKETLYFYRISLAALTAQPVKLPSESEPHSSGYGCAYMVETNGGEWLEKSEVIAAIRAAGYEVQE